MESQPYYQFWASLESQTKWMRLLLLSGTLLTAILLILFYRTLDRPVVIVRLDTDGKVKAELKKPGTPEVLDNEAVDYAREFLSLYLAPKSAAVGKNVARATAMMTPMLRKRHLEFFQKSKYIEKIQQLGVETNLNFQRMIVRRPHERRIDVYASGNQQARNHQGVLVFHPFQSIVRLREIARSPNNPYGLEVADLDFELRQGHGTQ